MRFIVLSIFTFLIAGCASYSSQVDNRYPAQAAVVSDPAGICWRGATEWSYARSGMIRDYLRGIRPTVQSAFCSAPSPTAKPTRSFILNQNVYIIWQDGSGAQTVIFNLKNGTAALQTGAATHVKVDVSRSPFAKEIRDYVVEETFDDGSKIANDRNLTAEQYLHATPMADRPSRPLQVNSSFTEAMQNICGLEGKESESAAGFLDDIARFCTLDSQLQSGN